MRFNQFSRLFSLVIFFTVSLSCGTNKESASVPAEVKAMDAQRDKLSLFNKLTENNHLPIEERIALYHKLKKGKSNMYDFKNDRELNQYGYSLLFDGKTKEAIEIFKLLVAEFPENSNAYDSLGEAYLKYGYDDFALKNYQKSVELNPENYNAVDQVAVLRGHDILVTDWGKEFFHFPLSFAPEIPYLGVEEVVFPKGWRKPESDDFWSYVFVWSLDNKKEITAAELQDNLKLYFDGLMDGVQRDSAKVMNKTEVHLESKANEYYDDHFVGELTIFDAFATDDSLTLNAKVFSFYCEINKKLTVFFRFSPKDFDHAIWNKLRTVGIRSLHCER